MKKLFYYSMTVLSLTVLALSCQKNLQEDKYVEENPNLVTLTCAFPTLDNENGTKVTLGADGKTAWEADVDAIVFQGCPKTKEIGSISPVIHTFTSAELANPEVASFSVDLSGLVDDEGMNHQINVAYPAGIWSPYSSDHMYGRSSFSNTNKMLMAGYVDGSNINLFHLTAAITFQVAGTQGDYDSYVFKGNNNEVVGYTKLLVEVNKPNVVSYRKKYKNSAPFGSAGPLTSITGPIISDGTAVNTVFLPVNTKDNAEGIDNADGANIVYLPTGFTIQLLKGGIIKKYITSTAPLTIRPGHMINLGELPAAHLHDYVSSARNNTIGVDVSTATDLSATATANCYIVDGSVDANAGASFKFKAARGKGGVSLNSIGGDDENDVVVLWETLNTNVAPSKGDIIAAVDYDIQEGKDAYIVFKMPDTITPGNALIAAKNAGGDILWSWHIWVPMTSISTNSYGDILGATALDRNLGALIPSTAGETPIDIKSLGLLYQWGRKDPFPGAASLASTSSPAAIVGSSITKVSGTITLDEAIANPTKISYTKDGDWISPSDNQLWVNTGKTIYDPCPPGFRVPVRDGSKVFWSSDMSTGANWAEDGTNGWFKLGNDPVSVFPFAGYLDDNGLSYKYAGTRALYWTSHRSGSVTSYGADVRYNDRHQLSSPARSRAGSVRCVAE